MPALPVVVLASGVGSNLQAILARGPILGIQVRAVISDRPEAQALARARAAGVATQLIRAKDHPDRDSYDAALMRAIDSHGAKLVVLAGFMRILSGSFVQRYSGRLLNIHPSLLPQFRGLHTHRRALESGDRIHGCSVHFVIEELDAGAVIAQAQVPVRDDDDEAELRTRVQTREHELYPEVLGWFAAGRIGIQGQRVMFDGVPLERPKVFPWQTPCRA